MFVWGLGLLWQKDHPVSSSGEGGGVTVAEGISFVPPDTTFRLACA